MNSELVGLLTSALCTPHKAAQGYYIAIELIVLLTGLHLWLKYNSVHIHTCIHTVFCIVFVSQSVCCSFVKHRKRLMFS